MKPPAGTALNTAGAFYSRLVHAWGLLEGSGTTIKDSVTGLTQTISGSLWGTDANGPILVNPGEVDLCLDSAMPTSAVTIIVGYRKRDATNRASGAFGATDQTNAVRDGAHCPYSDGTVYFDWGGSSGGTSRLSAAGLTFGTAMTTWGFDAGAAGMNIYQNGVLRATQAGHATRSTGTGNWGMGRHGGQSSDQYDWQFTYILNAQISGSEHASIAASLWQIYLTLVLGPRIGSAFMGSPFMQSRLAG